jgi:esterase FrsA
MKPTEDAPQTTGELLGRGPERDEADAFTMMLARARMRRNPFLQFPPSTDVGLVFERLGGRPIAEWCRILSDIAQDHAARAEQAAAAGGASLDEWRNAYSYWQLARYPVADTPERDAAYRNALAAFKHIVSFDGAATDFVSIPSGTSGRIPALLRTPPAGEVRTLVILIGGLDMGKEDALLNFGRTHVNAGRAVLAVDSPGTGEALYPLSPTADEGWSSVLSCVESQAQYSRCVVHGISMGGYWAARVAHIYGKSLSAAVNHGGPGQKTFGREWLGNWTSGDYPFKFLSALMFATGASSFDTLVERLAQLSLFDSGLADNRPCPLLLVNGVSDRTALFEDMLLLLMRGRPKSARFFEGGHMGMTAETLDVISRWIDEELAEGADLATSRLKGG